MKEIQRYDASEQVSAARVEIRMVRDRDHPFGMPASVGTVESVVTVRQIAPSGAMTLCRMETRTLDMRATRKEGNQGLWGMGDGPVGHLTAVCAWLRVMTIGIKEMVTLQHGVMKNWCHVREWPMEGSARKAIR